MNTIVDRRSPPAACPFSTSLIRRLFIGFPASALHTIVIIVFHKRPVYFQSFAFRLCGEQILAELKDVQALVTTRATPEEAAAFGQWLVTTAQAAADAAKDGGFMGFGAQQVSDREQAMLDQVRAAVSG